MLWVPRPRRIILRRQSSDVWTSTADALQRNGRIVPFPENPERTGSLAEWDISGQCERPVETEQYGRGHYMQTAKGMEWLPGRKLLVQVPCRQCAACLRARRTLWGRRAAEEWRTASRSWLTTLTFGPEPRFLNLARTRERLDNTHTDLSSLSFVDQFREQHRETGPLVSKAIRRLRKGQKKLGFGPQFIRYLLVVEPHKDWVPHYHLLVHEVSDLQPVRKTALKAFWPHGFVDAKLVDDHFAAFYAAKYLGKYSVARVRASKFYGLQSETLPEWKKF